MKPQHCLVAAVAAALLLVGGSAQAGPFDNLFGSAASLPPSAAVVPLRAAPELVSAGGKLDVTLVASPTRVTLGRWQINGATYNGDYAGPVLRLRPGDMLRLKLVNNLPQATNMHFHGLEVSPQGHGDNSMHMVAPGESWEYEIPIPKDHPPGVYWFHTHAHSFAEKQLMGGLSGTLVIEGFQDQVPATKPLTERLMALKEFTPTQAGDLQKVPKPYNFEIRSLNGQVMQSATTTDMVFHVAPTIAMMSACMTLEPGDVIVMGTPAGVGYARKPPVWMVDGDVIEIDIEGVGVLRNTVRNAAAAALGQWVAKTAVIVHESGEFGTGTAKLLAGKLPSIGITPKELIAHDNPTRNFDNIALRIRSLAPDIVMMSNYGNEYMLLARTLYQQKVNVAGFFSILGGGFNYKFVKEMPDVSQYMMDVNHWYNPKSPQAQALKKRVEATGVRTADGRLHELDVLVDLSGHTAGNRLLAFADRPAPLQATLFGYPNTTGLPAMGWRLTDAIADPARRAGPGGRLHQGLRRPRRPAAADAAPGRPGGRRAALRARRPGPGPASRHRAPATPLRAHPSGEGARAQAEPRPRRVGRPGAGRRPRRLPAGPAPAAGQAAARGLMQAFAP